MPTVFNVRVWFCFTHPNPWQFGKDSEKKSIASYSRISPPNNAADGTRKHTWEIKFETDGRKPLMKNYTCTDDPTKENHFDINTGLIQEMVKNKNK